MQFTIMTSMFPHALESLCGNYSVPSIFQWCFVITKRKVKEHNLTQKVRLCWKKERERERERGREQERKEKFCWGLSYCEGNQARRVKQSKWSQGPGLILAKCQEEAMCKGHDRRLKRSLAWLQSIRRSDAGTALFPFLFSRPYTVCIYI